MHSVVVVTYLYSLFWLFHFNVTIFKHVNARQNFLTLIDRKLILRFCLRHRNRFYNNFILFECTVTISGGPPDDSSSEENQTNTHKITTVKPVVPPRPRGITPVDLKRNGIPNNAVNASQSNKNSFGNDVPSKDTDASKADCKFAPFLPLLLRRKIDVPVERDFFFEIQDKIGSSSRFNRKLDLIWDFSFLFWHSQWLHSF